MSTAALLLGAHFHSCIAPSPLLLPTMQALEYVRQRYGFPLEATVACGDSGNDILMLSGPNLALAVGNSQPDLVTWLEQHKAEPSPLPGKQRLFRAQRHEAYGILEGLQHFGLA